PGPRPPRQRKDDLRLRAHRLVPARRQPARYALGHRLSFPRAEHYCRQRDRPLVQGDVAFQPRLLPAFSTRDRSRRQHLAGWIHNRSRNVGQRGHAMEYRRDPSLPRLPTPGRRLCRL
ncbi:uncharacterized protein METZ01_LOCUS486010, partial [marine metagenome]